MVGLSGRDKEVSKKRRGQTYTAVTDDGGKVFASIFGVRGQGRRDIRWHEFVQVRCADVLVGYVRAEDGIGHESRRHWVLSEWQARGIGSNVHSDDDEGEGDYADRRGKPCVNCATTSILMSFQASRQEALKESAARVSY